MRKITSTVLALALATPGVVVFPQVTLAADSKGACEARGGSWSDNGDGTGFCFEKLEGSVSKLEPLEDPCEGLTLNSDPCPNGGVSAPGSATEEQAAPAGTVAASPGDGVDYRNPKKEKAASGADGIGHVTLVKGKAPDGDGTGDAEAADEVSPANHNTTRSNRKGGAVQGDVDGGDGNAGNRNPQTGKEIRSPE